MSPVGAVSGFLRAPNRRRRIAAEAAGELVRARLRTLLPAHVYTRELGALGADGPAPTEAQEAEGERVGRMVAAVAAYMPFRALCLQQAIAVRRMLARRGVPAAVCLGVARAQADRAAPDAGRAAHAWVTVGDRVVSGDAELDRYAMVARFA